MLGNLWDVTDKDIDRFSESLFDVWGLTSPPKGIEIQESLEENPNPFFLPSHSTKFNGDKKSGINFKFKQGHGSPLSLTQSIAIARDACKLPYLVGAAPVLYGLPIVLDLLVKNQEIKE